MSLSEYGYINNITRTAIIDFLAANPGSTFNQIVDGVRHSHTIIRHWMWILFESGAVTATGDPHGGPVEFSDIIWGGATPTTFFWLQQDGSRWTQQDGSFWTQN